jgi:hypothetical protein
MKTLDTKQNILDDAGFGYNIDRAIYFSRKSKKIFSVEFIDDHDEEELERRIRENTGCEGWKFYFNAGEPSEQVRREIEASLGRH